MICLYHTNFIRIIEDKIMFKKNVKLLSGVIFVLSLLGLPFAYVGTLLGLAGSEPVYPAVIAVGYIGVVIFSFVSIFKQKFFPAILISIVVVIVGNTLDSRFWKKENDQTCRELRAEPSCVEDVCGFTCTSFHGMGFVTGAGICRDKDLMLCVNKMVKDEKAEDGLSVYSDIIDKIVASPHPERENFENQLIAIYNCLGEKYGPGADGESRAIYVLKQKNLTPEQLAKYYSYHASKGRNINPRALVAGLPGGDKKLSCEYINVDMDK